MTEPETAARLAATCQRLSETQRNMPVPLTEREYADLHDAAAVLHALSQQWLRESALAKLTPEERHVLGL